MGKKTNLSLKGISWDDHINKIGDVAGHTLWAVVSRKDLNKFPGGSAGPHSTPRKRFDTGQENRQKKAHTRG